MAKHLEPHIKRMNAKNNPKSNATETAKVGTNMKASTNEKVAEQGDLVKTASGKLDESIVNNENAHDAAKLATETQNKKNKDAAKAYNDAAVVVEQQFPGDTAAWEALGFEVTKEVVPENTVPDKVTNGSMSQGDYLGTADLHFDPSARADNYTVRITKGDPSVDASYIQVTKPKMVFTKSSIIVEIATEYLGFNLFFKVTAHNTVGSSPESEPFGGRKIQ